MSVINHTPFPAMAFRQYNARGELTGVVVARGTFRLVQNGPLRILDAQDPLPLIDVHGGDPQRTALTAPGVLVPFKPGTDVTFLGSAYAPGGRPAASWLCGLRVGPVEKVVRVHGPRWWEPVLGGRTQVGWHLTPAEPVGSVALDWSLAYGGPLPGGAGALHPANPLGCGILDPEAAAAEPGRSWPAPRIEAPDWPIRGPEDVPAPQGVGPVAPWWEPRLGRAGAFDTGWRHVRSPRLPAEFDFRFYQCAVPELVAEPFLRGDEAFQLVHLVPDAERLHGRLPGLRLRMRLARGGEDCLRDLRLDGVAFDLRPEVARVFLTWRAGFPWPDGRGMPELALLANRGAAA